MHQIIRHFTDDDLYKFTMCCAVIDNYPRAEVRYVFTDRGGTSYPPGFARELREQLRALEDLAITEEEIAYMKKACPYIPYWFYNYLKGFRYSSECIAIAQDCDGHLALSFEGVWSATILLEVKILAIISELYYIMTGQAAKFDLADFARRTVHKGRRLQAAGCVFSDFGTRRRASFAAQDCAVAALRQSAETGPEGGRFMGTSNVYLAMKYNLVPIGTMAHELICAMGGLYGPQMANYLAMQAWGGTFKGSLGTFLYDTYGWRIFSLNFSEDYANMFKGLRVDSGNNEHELDLITAKYRSLGIDSRSRQVVFSNGLTTDEAIRIQGFARGRCLPSYGIGTHFSNDFAGVEPLNIVIKLVAAKITESWPFYNDTCKLSEDSAKSTGKPEVIKRFRAILHLD